MTAAAARRAWGSHVKAVQYVDGLHDVRHDALEAVAARMVVTSRSNSMMAIYGPSGVGKSFATGRGAEMCAADPVAPADIVWVELTVSTQGKPLLRDLYPQLVGVEPPDRATARQLEVQLTRALADTHRVVVLDEAHLVRPPALRILRGLHDNPDTDFALVLVGLDSLMAGLPPELETRIQTRMPMSRLADDEIVDVLHSYHDVFHTADPDLLVMLNRTRARGEFRWWAFFLANVTEMMPVLKAKKLTVEIAEMAAEGLR